MQISQSVKLDFDDVLIRPKKSDLVSRQDAQLLRFFNFKHHDGTIQPGFVPIIAANMDTIGTPEMAYALMDSQMSTALHKSFDGKLEDRCVYNYVWFTIGTKDFDQEMSKLTQHKFNRRGSDICSPFMICIDVANGYASGFVDKVKEVRETFHNAVIMAGNVCTPELTQDLLINGADIVKVGIGPGKVCRTRMVTGVGYPQLSAIMECADCAHGLKGHVCADGGIREYGDIAKAFGAGADLVMLGTMLGGHDECAGEWRYKESNPYYHHEKVSHQVYGMASDIAQQKYGTQGRTPEGTDIWVPYKGSVKNTA
jgi:GMP reductase